MTEPTRSPLAPQTDAPLDAASVLYASASAASAAEAPPALSAAILHAAAQAAQARALAMHAAAATPAASEAAAQPVVVLMRYAQGWLKRLGTLLTLPSLRYGLPAMMVAGVAFQVAITSAPKGAQEATPMPTHDAPLQAAAPASAASVANGAAAKASAPRSLPSHTRGESPAPDSEQITSASKKTPMDANASAKMQSAKGFDENVASPPKDVQVRVTASGAAAIDKTAAPAPTPFPQTAGSAGNTAFMPAMGAASSAVANASPVQGAEASKPAAALASGALALDSAKQKATIKNEATADAIAAPPARAVANERTSAPAPASIAMAPAAYPAKPAIPAPIAPIASPAPPAAPTGMSAPVPKADAERTGAKNPARAAQNPSISLRNLIVRTSNPHGQLVETCNAQAPTLAHVQALLIDGANPNYASQASSTLALAQRCGFTEAAAAMQAALKTAP